MKWVRAKAWIDIKKIPQPNDSHGTIVRQLNVARSKLPLFPSPGLAKEMENAIKDLENESLILTQRTKNGNLKLGFDYVVVVEKASRWQCACGRRTRMRWNLIFWIWNKLLYDEIKKL